jgi:hypothetical protein
MILDRPARDRETGPLRSPMNTEESTETMCKDDWPMRPGDHGRTVIMAVPPTAHAMFRHSPTVDVKSLGDAIHFAAHKCARAELSDIVPQRPARDRQVPLVGPGIP